MKRVPPPDSFHATLARAGQESTANFSTSTLATQSGTTLSYARARARTRSSGMRSSLHAYDVNE